MSKLKQRLKADFILEFDVLDVDGSLLRQGEAIGHLHKDGNGLTTAGINDLLDKYFAGSAYTAAWYMGLVNNSGFSAFDVADTSASHAGWTETAGYTEANRPTMAWSSAAAAVKATSGNIDFSINTSVTVHGIFIISNNTKSGNTGILFATAAFSSNQALVSGQTLRITSYTITGAEG